MTKKMEKLLILREYVQFQLYLQNSYHDKARETYKKVHIMLDEFYRQKRISKFCYKKWKRELKQYDIMYAGLDIRETRKNWNGKAYISGKSHFG